ncbi:DUF4823 domain-containing protein [Achromobacter ruhlandii]|uniref:DUF4823 domain-containing protein n=1 Tax=Achromobacter ruhlandii TaxID=72557 RepID=UPI001581A549|nr:DUF4823 domain-containing protein [Achromobacter ruhlandii]
MKRAAISLSVFVFIAGCTATHQSQRLSPSAQPLDKTQRVYVAWSADGGYGGKTAAGSGAQSATSLATAFAQRGVTVDVSSQAETPEQAIASASRLGAAYAVMPTILNWEHRATAWSAIPSKLSMRVDVWDARAGTKLDSTVLESKSAAFTFLSTGPELLLRDTVAPYVAALYGETPAPPRTAGQ